VAGTSPNQQFHSSSAISFTWPLASGFAVSPMACCCEGVGEDEEVRIVDGLHVGARLGSEPVFSILGKLGARIGGERQ